MPLALFSSLILLVVEKQDVIIHLFWLGVFGSEYLYFEVVLLTHFLFFD
jgi:hypothetical protein